VLSAWTAGPSDPIMGQPIQGADPGQKAGAGQSHDLRAGAIQVPALLVPGLRPVSVKGIQAARRAARTSLDRARPALAEGQGCGLALTQV
jgi:hypothetical protein